jgi:hypothetical protein
VDDHRPSEAFYADLRLNLSGSGAEAELAGSAASEPACAGPWSPELQHGGPPNALLVLAAERLAALAGGRDDLVAVRLAAEFLAPVPVAPLWLRARVERLSRTAVLVMAELGVEERASLRARIWLLATGEQAGEQAGGRASETGQSQSSAVAPDPLQLAPYPFDTFGYARHLDWRQVHGSPYEPGPAQMWIRSLIPLVAGERMSGLQRAALVADSASGISAELDWQDWSFANVDLDLHLFRPGSGDWLLMDAHTELGAGVAMTRSSLADLSGPVGAGLQTLLVRRLSP